MMNATLEGREKLRPRFDYLKRADDQEPFYPRVAALEMQPEFRSIARQLAPRDPSTQDDLIQEMTLAVLLINQPQTRSFYRVVACWRAIDYLRWWYDPLRLSQVSKDEEKPLTSPELTRACEALNLLLRGEGAAEIVE